VVRFEYILSVKNKEIIIYLVQSVFNQPTNKQIEKVISVTGQSRKSKNNQKPPSHKQIPQRI
jgi:hypothetical protein